MSSKSKSPPFCSHSSKVFAEFGEAAYYQELLALRGMVYFFVLEDPGVAVGDEDRVEAGGHGRIDVGLRAVADHPGGIAAAFVLLGKVPVDLGTLLCHDLHRREILLHSRTLHLS